ncbi:DUF1697 domain-containing protein [Sphaerisporangium fuscum]|uniref:DUF1697 domain-containing protein n=1 Tax=Sphaerisporangium fuscum TaxID=2835868 RepID=UPI001BDBE98E|nr:DUF1697 domain-containing protein [Sphaerisporangium fuscum]
MRYVALLRGINISPQTTLAMGDLREVLESLGYGGVRTYLRSGNALLTADGEPPERVASAIERRIGERLGRKVPVVIRTADELRATVEENPLEVRDPVRFAVTFYAREPDRQALEAIDPADYAPEEMRVGRREIYTYYPDGLRRTKLAPLLAKLPALAGNTATTRNWSTVTKLLALAVA